MNISKIISEVGLGIAMWNGRSETKHAADLIIGPNYSDAIAKVLNSSIMQK